MAFYFNTIYRSVLLLVGLVSTVTVNMDDYLRTNDLENNSASERTVYSAWNMRSLSTGLPYLRHLMETSDIIAVSEHSLYESQLWKLKLTPIFRWLPKLVML